jgi:hypothetical protein
MDNLQPYRLLPSRASAPVLPISSTSIWCSRVGEGTHLAAPTTLYRSTLVFRMNGRRTESYLHAEQNQQWVPVQLRMAPE